MIRRNYPPSGRSQFYSDTLDRRQPALHLWNIYYNYWMNNANGFTTEPSEKNVYWKLALRGAVWTAPIWLPLIASLMLSGFKTAQYYEQPASLLTIIDSIKSWSSALSLLAVFGTPLGLPIGAIFAGGAAGPGDAFKRGFFSVFAIVAADLLMLLLSAFYYLIIRIDFALYKLSALLELTHQCPL